MSNKQTISVESRHIKRIFECSQEGFRTLCYTHVLTEEQLMSEETKSEGSIIVNNIDYKLGGNCEDCFVYRDYKHYDLEDGGQRLEVSFCAPTHLKENLLVTIVYEALDIAPVLIKSIIVDNIGTFASRVDGLQLEEIIPSNGEMGLILEDDYVRGAMVVNGKPCRSPWIEHQQIYVKKILTPISEKVSFKYPEIMDRWLMPRERFVSFRVYEFIVPNCDEEKRGLEFRKATRGLMPWTTEKWLSCALAPATQIDDYYKGIELAAEVGYEAIHLHHGWIDGVLTSPLFTTYGDYKLRPDLFPGGWKDVKSMTDFAHSKGIKISFYTIYVSIWDDMQSKAVAENQWELVWSKDDDSARWGKTLCPGTDWGPYVNRRMEEAMIKGGFDAWHLDGPYYGDVSVAEERPYKPGGPNQLLAWERQAEFYEIMRAHGFHGEAAQGFCAFSHGMSRITTTGYDEGDFGRKSMWDQIISTRKGAYYFTKIYRPEQSTTFIPVVSWLHGPDLEPMEEKTAEYNAYLANCFGYGFEGKCFQRVPYEGPKSKSVVLRWINFWKEHEDFFKEGYLLHVREPDGNKLDAVMHVIENSDSPRALLVVYNPKEIEQVDELDLPFGIVNLPLKGWTAISEADERSSVVNTKLAVCIPAKDATWYELNYSNR